MQMQKPSQSLPANYLSKGTLDISKDQKAALVLSAAGIVLFIIFGVLFAYLMWRIRPQDAGQLTNINVNIGLESLFRLLLFIVAALVINMLVVVLHEAVHGLFFWLFTGSRPGFAFKIWYAYASAPSWYLPRGQYFIVAVSPLVVLTLLGFALVPFVPSWMLLPLLLFLTLNASGAVGDIAVAVWLLFQPPSCMVNDHGDAVTLYVPGRIKRKEIRVSEAHADLFPFYPARLSGRYISLDHGNKVGDIQRLGDVTVATGVEGLLAVAGQGIGGQGNDWNTRRGGVRFEHIREAPAVDLGDGKVEQDQDRMRDARDIQAAASIARAGDGKTFLFQQKADQVEVVGVVFDDQDRTFTHSLSLRRNLV